MATVNNNLSDYDINSIPDASAMTFGIVVSEWNNNITSGLLQGAFETLIKHGAKKENIHVHWVPGSFELALGAQFLYKYYGIQSVICLGSVIRGETAHFDFVCQATSMGIMDVGLKEERPTIFGVLTDDNLDQAIARSGGKHGNKGTEAAITAIKMVAMENKLQEGFRETLSKFNELDLDE